MLNVAVKTLHSKASEGDTVRFLQEAAIMGQFKHPNVVRLYGVVTDKEYSVSIDICHRYHIHICPTNKKNKKQKVT